MYQKMKFQRVSKRCISMALAGVLACSLIPPVPQRVSAAQGDKPVMLKAGSIPATEDQVTYGEPFAQWTAGSKFFRIPALVTLQDGSLLATADARWETTGDGGGLDSIASISVDGGNTWNYSFPLFFPDSDGYAGPSATTIIDPGVVEGPDGTIYFIADVNPTGSTTMYKTIGTGTGYVTVDNGQDQGRYLALTEDYNNVETTPSDQDLEKYPYYVGDLDEDGYALILRREDGSETGYGVDEWFNIYTVEGGEFIDNLTQKQVNSDVDIQQNAFYKDSRFHVYSIDYLWVVTSKDGGRTWEHPRDLTDQIKRHTDEHALLVSPGQGITTSQGDIVIGFYDHGVDEENASLVYSTDNGQTWDRTEDMQRTQNGGFWTSENEVVELWDGTLRMFARNGQGRICYADITKNDEGGYTMSPTSVRTEVSATSTCNVTAISYSKPIDGKQAILVACPTGGTRAKGKIFTFLVEEDNSLSLYNTIDVPEAETGFVYACLTEMQDGTVALLWEPNKWDSTQVSILFDKFSILDLAPQAQIEDVTVNVELGLDGTYTRTYDALGEPEVTLDPDGMIAVAETESGPDGWTVTISALGEGITKAVIDGVLYKIKVTDDAWEDIPGCTHANTYTRGECAADCFDDGYTGELACSACGATISEGDRIPATGHDWDEGIVTKMVTSTENGEKVHHCKNEPFHTRIEVIYASAYAPFIDAYGEAGKALAQAGAYTSQSLARLSGVYSDQKQAAKSGAGRRELYEGAKELREALEALVTRPVSVLKSELASAVAAARLDYEAGKGSLPDQAWNDFKEAYEKATSVNAEAGANELWALKDNLTKAHQSVRNAKIQQDLAAAKTELAAGVAAAKAIYDAGSSGYTQDSWKAFSDAYQAAAGASSLSDAAAIRSILGTLQNAQAGLVKAADPIEAPIKDGAVIQYKNVRYKVLSAAKKTVAATKGLKKSEKKVTIPATVNINGVKCTVVQVGANAFKGYSKLTEVTVGKHVTEIGKNAFAGCKKLAKMTLKGTKLTSVKEKAFKNTSAKLKVAVPKGLKKARRQALLRKLKTAGASKKVVVK